MREDGYYWVRCSGSHAEKGWQVGEWSSQFSEWELTHCTLNLSEDPNEYAYICEVGPKINPPETETIG